MHSKMQLMYKDILVALKNSYINRASHHFKTNEILPLLEWVLEEDRKTSLNRKGSTFIIVRFATSHIVFRTVVHKGGIAAYCKCKTLAPPWVNPIFCHFLK